jgi:predicted lipoprotein with Yx(FWY)xxD motif
MLMASLVLTLLTATLPVGAVPAFAVTQTTIVQVAQTANLGSILTGPNGMTLYVFAKDTWGVSNCYDKCAVNWPPLLLKAGEMPLAPIGLQGRLGTVTRTDGTIQVTYNDWPLYYWSKDKAPGDTTGQNVGKVWFVANPDAPTVKLSEDRTLGRFFTDANDMTLYVFTKDTPGVSNCYDKCATNWPPLLLKAGEQLVAPQGLGGKLGTTTRKDGSLQVTFNGAPLYHWFKDRVPGDTTGHLVGGVWFAVEPGLLLDTAGTWSQALVSSAVRAGWVRGDTNSVFHPNDMVTRAEFVTMLTAAFAAPAGSAQASFADTGAHWANGAIEAAVAAGVVKVAEYPAGQFEPDRAITREEAMAMVVRALHLEAGAAAGEAVVARFTDAGMLSSRTAGLVGVAVDKGIVKGYPDNTIHGEKTSTRAEAVVLVQRALGLKK